MMDSEPRDHLQCRDVQEPATSFPDEQALQGCLSDVRMSFHGFYQNVNWH